MVQCRERVGYVVLERVKVIGGPCCVTVLVASTITMVGCGGAGWWIGVIALRPSLPSCCSIAIVAVAVVAVAVDDDGVVAVVACISDGVWVGEALCCKASILDDDNVVESGDSGDGGAMIGDGGIGIEVAVVVVVVVVVVAVGCAT
jgi:hypothetical protein